MTRQDLPAVGVDQGSTPIIPTVLAIIIPTVLAAASGMWHVVRSDQ
eukprot:COSAG01_NODE_63576_length_279_cov_1.122222_1_plen_45_part_01